MFNNISISVPCADNNDKGFYWQDIMVSTFVGQIFSLIGKIKSVYFRIYFEVRKHQQRGPAVYEFQRSKKALATTLLILGTFMLCWLPMCLFQVYNGFINLK